MTAEMRVVGEASRNGKSYQVINVIGSHAIPDGRYYYDPADKQIDFQERVGIGSERLPAPQAVLMSTVINGILRHSLPWGLVLLGVFIVVVMELCGVRSLAFAVGSYLPIATTAPIFMGGVVSGLLQMITKRQEGEVSSGALFAAGLIAGGSIGGLILAALVGFEVDQKVAIGTKYWPRPRQLQRFWLADFPGDGRGVVRRGPEETGVRTLDVKVQGDGNRVTFKRQDYLKAFPIGERIEGVIPSANHRGDGEGAAVRQAGDFRLEAAGDHVADLAKGVGYVLDGADFVHAEHESGHALGRFGRSPKPEHPADSPRNTDHGGEVRQDVRVSLGDRFE